MRQLLAIKIYHISLWIVAIILISVFKSLSFAQESNIEDLLQYFEQGNYESIDELLKQEEIALPALLKLANHSDVQARLTALDLLARIDLKDNGILDRKEVIQAMNTAISNRETSSQVVNEALQSLQKIKPGKFSPDLPDLMDNLLSRLEDGNAKAALILGQTGDVLLIPVLEPYLISSDEAVAESTQLALARLGDKQSLLTVLSGLDVEGPMRSKAFEKLVYIDSTATVRGIAKFLYDSGTPNSEVGPRDRVVHLPYSYMAAWALGQIVENPPVKKDVGLLSEQDIEIWQTWWEAHQHEYP